MGSHLRGDSWADIVLRGVRVHNLKGIDVTIPTRRLVVITGVSGSGKSSLAFDTLYVEGRRRYVESLSVYARQFRERLERPDADALEGLCPAVAIRQRSPGRSPRSTVATATEIHDHLRLLFARAGQTTCEGCKIPVRRESAAGAEERLLAVSGGGRALVAFAPPSPLGPPEIGALRRRGYRRLLVGETVVEVGDEADGVAPEGALVLVDRVGLREEELAGIERGHRSIEDRLVESVVVELDEAGEPQVREDPSGVDVVGHGTACAGIIHDLAPAADLVSIRVLGPDTRGKGVVFAAGLDWAIERGARVVNLSLSSKSDALFGTFHELADRAYFANVVLVSAANNYPGPSYPSLFASVISVAAHDVPDAWAWYYNPDPPVEFGAYGLDVDVAWRNGIRIVATGNSFAAPHVAGLATLIRAKHPEATPFEVKAILAATSNGALASAS